MFWVLPKRSSWNFTKRFFWDSPSISCRNIYGSSRNLKSLLNTLSGNPSGIAHRRGPKNKFFWDLSNNFSSNLHSSMRLCWDSRSSFLWDFNRIPFWYFCECSFQNLSIYVCMDLSKSFCWISSRIIFRISFWVSSKSTVIPQEVLLGSCQGNPSGLFLGISRNSFWKFSRSFFSRKLF